jgi:uncharacterized protein (TIGR00369 family)
MDENKADLLKTICNYARDLPFNHYLGLDFECFDVDNRCIRFDMRNEFEGNQHFHVLHGGMIAAVLDSVGGFLLALHGAWRAEAGSASPILVKGGTVDLHINYLRPGKGKRFVATGSILRYGNKVAVIQGELRNEDDDLIAVSLATYMIG